ncbi:MAG: caspase family protein [Bacteroidota bacterium]
MKYICPIFVFFTFFCSSYLNSQENEDIIQHYYKSSHALLIGCSDYNNGLKKLPGVKEDIQKIKEALIRHGFEIIIIENPNSLELEKSIKDFINKYGLQPENRLLIFYAGHGHTLQMTYGETMGYIIPVDVPNPLNNQQEFLEKAVPMERIELFAKQIQSKHALFVFDACFAGTIFSINRDISPSMEFKINQPVRQFITSGSENESVPDKSIFCQLFISGINGDADLNKDGYVTGTELGEYLQENVINYSTNFQHPKYGKIRHPKHDKGDFIFKNVNNNISNIQSNMSEISEKNNVRNTDINVFPLKFLNNDFLNFAPLVTSDRKTILFVSNRPGSKLNKKGYPSFDIWCVKKEKIFDTTFSEPINFESLNSEYDEGAGTIATDGTTFYFSIDGGTDQMGASDIYFSRLEGSAFSKPVNLGPNVNSPYKDFNPSISSDQMRLYFTSNRPGPNGPKNMDIWYSDYDTTIGDWKPAQNLREINTKGREFSSYIGADNLTLFFTSDSIKPNIGGLDFYCARYDYYTKTFSKPVNLGQPFNTAEDDLYLSIPPTGDIIYISSKRNDIDDIQSRINIFMIYMKDLKK